MEVINAIGRRKAAVARVYLNDGKGQIMILSLIHISEPTRPY
jgi:ribosomal protein S9